MTAVFLSGRKLNVASAIAFIPTATQEFFSIQLTRPDFSCYQSANFVGDKKVC
jgi:hypothetical protein